MNLMTPKIVIEGEVERAIHVENVVNFCQSTRGTFVSAAGLRTHAHSSGVSLFFSRWL